MKKTTNDSPSFSEGNRGNTGLIVLITILVCLVVFLTVILGIFARRTISIDRQVAKLEKTVAEISKTAQTLEGADLQTEQASQTDQAETTSTPEASADKEESSQDGTLSPSKGEKKVVTGDLAELQSQLQAQVDTLNASDGTWAIYTENLNTNASCTIGDAKMQAASLIKLFIMGAVYENYDAVCQTGGGRETVNSALSSMITVSDNDAANNLVTWLGGGDPSTGMAAVNSFCESHGYSNTHMGRMLLSSNASDDNYTSVTDCGKILREIYDNSDTLTYPELMYKLLKQQERTNKIPAGIPAVDGAQVANKTGELDSVENDAAIIYSAPRNDFVLCIMAQDLSDTATAQSNIQALSTAIYGYFNQ